MPLNSMTPNDVSARKWLLGSFLALILGLGGGPAFAQSAPSSEAAAPLLAKAKKKKATKKKKSSKSDLAKARKAFKEASEEYKVGNFEGALEGFSLAYKLSERPQLLFNLGQCHKELGNWERALFFFNSYQRDVPGAKNADFVQGLITEVEGELEAKRLKEEEEEQRKREAAEREAEEAERRAALEQAQLEAAQKQAELDVPVYKKWWFWTNQPTTEPCGSLGCTEVQP
jgi:tetratricopeptide (TPR) repeat protein